MLLKDRVAIVTGGGSGMGKAISLKYAGEGSNIAVVDINLDAAKKTAAEVKSLGRRSLALKAQKLTRW